jgi:hypothetical protein
MRRSITREQQQYLKDLGLYHGSIDGLWGRLSETAVMAFQEMNGLTADGIIGPNTRRAMSEHLDNEWRDKIEKPASKNHWPKESTASLIEFYGQPGSSRVKLKLPYQMRLSWDKGVIINSMSCHEKVAPSLKRIFNDIKKNYSMDEIRKHGFDLYGGCYVVRKIRGGSRWSTHSWGCAIDLDPARNGLRTKWKDAYFSRPECAKFVEAFEKEGWYSLGKNRNYDAMHWQAAYRN